MSVVKHSLWPALLIVVALVLGLSLQQRLAWSRFEGKVSRLTLDLAQPDALIVSTSLARLPRDILQAPMLREVLKEDFVFYYEHNEDRLSLVGSLRRLAYEHERRWQDKLIELALGAPAELALWRDAKGALRHYLLVMERGMLAKWVQEAATLVLKDSQLKLAAELTLEDDAVPVLALNYGRERSLLIAAYGKRVVVLSDPGLLLTTDGTPDAKAVAVVLKLLGKNRAEQHVLRQSLAVSMDEAQAKSAPMHQMAFSARYLSFGYQAFFPAIETLRFDFSGQQWSTALRIAGQFTAPGEHLAQVLPARPAACIWLPMQWPTVKSPALPRLAPTAVACWYGQSSLHMPLLVAELTTEPSETSDAELRDFFAWLVKGRTETPDAKENVAQWQNQTFAPHGPHTANGKPYYQPTLARYRKMLFFSPDEKLVAQALQTAQRRYPSVADTLPTTANANLAVFNPESLAALLRGAAFATLPRGEQPVLHDAAQTHLTPRLKALATLPPLRLSMPATTTPNSGWYPLQWQTLVAQP